MRSSLVIIVLTLLLAACGAKSDLAAAAGTGGAGSTSSVTATASSAGTGGSTGTGGGGPLPQQLAQLRNTCGPTDAPAIGLMVSGLAGCPLGTQPVPGLEVTVWDPALAELHAGGTVKLGGNVNSSATSALRWSVVNGVGISTPVTGGSLFIETFIMGAGATGTYAVSFADGLTEQGSFNAMWCTSQGPCGG